MSKESIPSKRLALGLLATAQFMVILDATIINIALPSIQRDLQFSAENLSWVPNAYVLMFGGFLLLAGRMADILGRRRMFIAGMTLFAVASLLGGFSQSELQLIICRGAQGLGAAMISPAALSTISVIFHGPTERNRAFAVWGAAAGCGGLSGVLLGGILTEFLGWEWVLFVNVPVGIAAALLAPRLLPESREPGRHAPDFLGGVTITTALILIVYAIVSAHEAGIGSVQTLGVLGIGFALIGAFVTIENRRAEPLISFSIFKLPTLRTANMIAFTTGTVILSTYLTMSLYFQQVLGFTALQSGLAVLPPSILSVVSATVAGRMVTRFGYKPTLMFGETLLTIGLVWLTQISADGSYWTDAAGPLLLIGPAYGAAFVPITIAAMAGTDRTNAGLASGLLTTNQQIGGAVGLALLISVSTAATADKAASGAAQLTALNDGLSTGLLVPAAFAALSLLTVTFLLSSSDSRAHRDETRSEVAVSVT